MPCLPDPHEYWKKLPVINRVMIDWLIAKGVKPLAMGSGFNSPLKLAYGHCADDGWFDDDPSGDPHIGILVEDRAGAIDVAFWRARSGRTGMLRKDGFALGEEQINNPGVCALGGALKVWQTPLEWLQAGRDGIFILKPAMAWPRLRHVQRIEARDHQHARHLKRLLRPPHGPEVCTASERAAA